MTFILSIPSVIVAGLVFAISSYVDDIRIAVSDRAGIFDGTEASFFMELINESFQELSFSVK
jgi:hypothetical protein